MQPYVVAQFFIEYKNFSLISVGVCLRWGRRGIFWKLSLQLPRGPDFLVFFEHPSARARHITFFFLIISTARFSSNPFPQAFYENHSTFDGGKAVYILILPYYCR